MSNAGISRGKSTGEYKFASRAQRTVRPQATEANLYTTNDLQHCLYQRNEVIFVSKEDFRTSRLHKAEVYNYWCKGCHQERTEPCQRHGPHLSLKITTTVNNNNDTNNNNSNNNYNNVKLPNALESFPNEVGLCISGIPCAGYGVCARQTIPLGTWIGPYEGELVRPEEVVLGSDASYMWEIFHEGKLLYYIDGRDENKSSWMRYIRCARNGAEQNMFSFQYCGNIYYRAFKEIPPGTELLVWYDEKYPQYMGIPLEICETSPRNPVDPRQHQEMVVAIPRDSSHPAFSHSYQPSSSPLTDNLQLVPSPRSTRARSTPPSRNKRHLTQNAPFRGERLHAPVRAEGSKRVCHVSWANDGASLQSSARVTENFPFSEDPRFAQEGQAVPFGIRSGIVQNTQTNGHQEVTSSGGLHSSNLKLPQATVKERPSRSLEEDEENSSDGSDASILNCGQCGKSFAQRSVLQIHVCPNMPRKPYHCGQCTETFDYPNELRTHAVIHAGEKPFKCGYCSRSFAGATTLHNHVRTHTGEKPFSCERCGKNFTQASQLHKHESIPGDCVPFDSLPD